jgi:hypothetical protein
VSNVLALLSRPVGGYAVAVHLFTCAGIVAACWAIAMAFTSDRDTPDEP